MRSRRLTVVAVAALLACSAAEVLAQRPPPFTPGSPLKPEPAPSAPTPVGPSFKVGALLPLNGPGAWFGAEIKQGLELAAAEVTPAPPRGSPLSAGSASGSDTTPGSHGGSPAAPGAAASGSGAGSSAATGASTTGPPASTGTPTGRTSAVTTGASPAGPSSTNRASPTGPGASSAGSPPRDQGGSSSGGTGTAGASSDTTKPATPSVELDEPREVALVVQAADVQPLDVRDAESEVAKLLGAGAVAIVTASPTPTLTVYPLASGRDVLVLHAGLATERFPATSRTLIQLRPSVAARADVLAAHAWARGIRRLAVLSGGD